MDNLRLECEVLIQRWRRLSEMHRKCGETTTSREAWGQHDGCADIYAAAAADLRKVLDGERACLAAEQKEPALPEVPR